MTHDTPFVVYAGLHISRPTSRGISPRQHSSSDSLISPGHFGNGGIGNGSANGNGNGNGSGVSSLFNQRQFSDSMGVDSSDMDPRDDHPRDLYHPRNVTLQKNEKIEEEGGVGRKKMSANTSSSPSPSAVAVAAAVARSRAAAYNHANNENNDSSNNDDDNDHLHALKAPKEKEEIKEEGRANLYQQLDQHRNPKYLLWIFAGTIHPQYPSIPLSPQVKTPHSCALNSLSYPLNPPHKSTHLPPPGITLCIICVTCAFGSFNFGDPTDMHMHGGQGLEAASGSIFSCAVICSTIWMGSFRYVLPSGHPRIYYYTHE